MLRFKSTSSNGCGGTMEGSPGLCVKVENCEALGLHHEVHLPKEYLEQELRADKEGC